MVARTPHQAHERLIRLRGLSPVKVVVLWMEDDLSDVHEHHVASYHGWQVERILGRCIHRWKDEESYWDAKQHLCLGMFQMENLSEVKSGPASLVVPSDLSRSPFMRNTKPDSRVQYPDPFLERWILNC